MSNSKLGLSGFIILKLFSPLEFSQKINILYKAGVSVKKIRWLFDDNYGIILLISL